jgi:hypothetical protein
VVHEPFTQTAGAVHCASPVQVVLHVSVAASHRPGAQFVLAGVTQVPVPLQVAGGVRTDAVMQRAGWHCVPAAQRAH